MEVSLRPEIILTINNFHLTNSFFTSLVTSLTVVLLFFLVTRSLRLIPSFSQNILELVFEALYNLNFQLAGQRVWKIFPWFVTFFVFILVANLIGLLPGFGSIGFYEIENGHKIFTPLLRPVNSDLNMTLGLALVSLAATHILSLKELGAKEYLARFFSLNPVNLFVGLLEIIAEITKLFSLSFRLFGNIFAGEAVLFTISKFFAFLLPIPFVLLEIVVGFVQALIFAMLTMVFMVILTTRYEEKVHERR